MNKKVLIATCPQLTYIHRAEEASLKINNTIFTNGMTAFVVSYDQHS